ncbi:hypothetical protein CK222_30775 [Mesorhizobium sp. WSM3866]|uniref:hypothetical protein n=1 Tax=Mesorhizobium sp. WSM3866 TaxID=422271 RepID=UPI000BAEFC64|nr:hypothetical protein [Mesorhizobium sp. WSM3866]PBB39947.1 hypothetical protein CK222_30775 [Mesorhizobium sp. WSM3866]
MSDIQTKMTPAYDEIYDVGPISFGIAKTDTGFSVWKSDCMTGEFSDIAQARKAIHDQARLHCAQELNAAKKELEEAEAILKRLSEGPSGLDHFACDDIEV